jgi:hypothetical protein
MEETKLRTPEQALNFEQIAFAKRLKNRRKNINEQHQRKRSAQQQLSLTH